MLSEPPFPTELAAQTHAISSAETPQAAFQSLREALATRGVLGFSYAIAAHRPNPDTDELGYTLSLQHCFPPEWQEEIGDIDDLENDASVDLLAKGKPHVWWSEPPEGYVQTAAQKDIWEAEDRIGMTYGVSVIIRGRDESVLSGSGLWFDVNSAEEERAHYTKHKEDFTTLLATYDSYMRKEGNLNVLLGLTPRELETLSFFVKGYRAAEVAARLKISPRTLEKHVLSARTKLKARTRDQMIAKAIAYDLIQI